MLIHFLIFLDKRSIASIFEIFGTSMFFFFFVRLLQNKFTVKLVVDLSCHEGISNRTAMLVPLLWLHSQTTRGEEEKKQGRKEQFPYSGDLYSAWVKNISS